MNDCGYDYDAGLFERSKVSDYFLPATSPVGSGIVYPVVIDIPREAFKSVFRNTWTRLVYG